MDEDDEYKGHVLTADVDDAGVCDGDDAGDDVIMINLYSFMKKKIAFVKIQNLWKFLISIHISKTGLMIINIIIGHPYSSLFIPLRGRPA